MVRVGILKERFETVPDRFRLIPGRNDYIDTGSGRIVFGEIPFREILPSTEVLVHQIHVPKGEQ
jgi:hypothetical protein